MTENEVQCAINNLKDMYQGSLDKDETYLLAIQALEEIQQYRAIGTIEEFKALKEKSVAKKVMVEHIPKTSWTKEVSHYLCPSCRSIFSFGGKPYCSNCGQTIDWQ